MLRSVGILARLVIGVARLGGLGLRGILELTQLRLQFFEGQFALLACRAFARRRGRGRAFRHRSQINNYLLFFRIVGHLGIPALKMIRRSAIRAWKWYTRSLTL